MADQQTAAATAPSPRLLVREQGNVSILTDTGNGPLTAIPGFDKLPCSFARSSADGSMLAIVTPSEVVVREFPPSSTSSPSSSSSSVLLRFPAQSVSAAAFSPLGSFLQTFRKPDGGQTRNLTVHAVRGGSEAPVWQQFQKTFSRADWPTLQFTADERVAYRTVSGEVQFYDFGATPGAAEVLASPPTGRLKAAGLQSAAVAPSPASHVAAFFPSHKGAPASVRLYKLDGLTTNAAGGGPIAEPQPVARRSFFKASSVRMLWGGSAREGAPASGVVVWTHTDVDKTNQSYYGESGLHFLATDGSFEGSVPLGKEGPIHDVQWSPCGRFFIVVHGFMPSKATLFDGKCKPLFDFGSGPRNMVRWNPQSRFIMLAGFGNLPGDVEFWDREKLKQLGTTKAACGVTAEWAPHGRSVLVATTAPRLQVDNCVRELKYDGTLLRHAPYSVLLEAEWVPAPKGTYPDRPPSPRAKGSAAASHNAPAGSAQAPAPAAKPYRPPNATGASDFRAKISGAADRPQRLDGGKPLPLGSEAAKPSKSALKNQKKKQNREKKAQGGDGAAEDNDSAVAAVTESIASAAVSDSAPAAASASGEGTTASESSADATAKKIRNLTKKVRQIEELKAKADVAGGVDKLTPEQREKLSQEGALRAELDALQA